MKVFDSLSMEQKMYGGVGMVLLSFFLLIVARFAFRYKSESSALSQLYLT